MRSLRTRQVVKVRPADIQEVRSQATDHVLWDVKGRHGDQETEEEDSGVADDLVEEGRDDDATAASVVGVWRQVVKVLALAVGENDNFCRDHLQEAEEEKCSLIK